MRTWTRAVTHELCAGCGGHLRIGVAVQAVELPNTKRLLRYGACCAQGSVPPNLPDRIEPGSRTKRMIPLSKVKLLFDWKARQSGEREPGAEG